MLTEVVVSLKTKVANASRVPIEDFRNEARRLKAGLATVQKLRQEADSDLRRRRTIHYPENGRSWARATLVATQKEVDLLQFSDERGAHRRTRRPGEARGTTKLVLRSIKAVPGCVR